MYGLEPKVRESGAQDAVYGGRICGAIEPIEETAHFRADRRGGRSHVMYDLFTDGAADNLHGISVSAEGPRFDDMQARSAVGEERSLPTDESIFAQFAVPIGGSVIHYVEQSFHISRSGRR